MKASWILSLFVLSLMALGGTELLSHSAWAQNAATTWPPALPSTLPAEDSFSLSAVYSPVNQFQAERYCSDRGLRLPTPLELAINARGLKSIRTTQYPGVSENNDKVSTEIESNKNDGYETISTWDDSQKTSVVYFYYNKWAPDNGSGETRVWAEALAHALNAFYLGTDGSIGVENRAGEYGGDRRYATNFGVRCFIPTTKPQY